MVHANDMLKKHNLYIYFSITTLFAIIIYSGTLLHLTAYVATNAYYYQTDANTYMHYSANCLFGSCCTGIWHLAANALIILDTLTPTMSKIECKLSQTSVCCLKNKNRQSSIHNRWGVGVTKPISSVPFFSEIFSIVKTHVRYWISLLYLAGIAAAQLRWYLFNMKVIQRI